MCSSHGRALEPAEILCFLRSISHRGHFAARSAPPFERPAPTGTRPSSVRPSSSSLSRCDGRAARRWRPRRSGRYESLTEGERRPFGEARVEGAVSALLKPSSLESGLRETPGHYTRILTANDSASLDKRYSRRGEYRARFGHDTHPRTLTKTRRALREISSPLHRVAVGHFVSSLSSIREETMSRLVPRRRRPLAAG